jgi:FAD dependent oxidoreductase
MASLARQGGVEVREHEPVTTWGTEADGVWVETASGRYAADRLIVTPGSWANRMLADLGLPITVLRKTLFWLEVKDPSRFAPERFPVYIGDRPGLELYGFPIYGQPGLKCANHFGGKPTTPETVDRTVHAEENAEIIEDAGWLFGQEQFTGRVLSSAVCLYASTPDHDFMIDHHPAHPTSSSAPDFPATASSSPPQSGNISFSSHSGKRQRAHFSRWSASPPRRRRGDAVRAGTSARAQHGPAREGNLGCRCYGRAVKRSRSLLPETRNSRNPNPRRFSVCRMLKRIR